MEHFPKPIDAYLTNIKSYLYSSALDAEREDFVKRIHSIPNVEEQFTKLAEAMPNWIELANGTAPMYYLEKVSLEMDYPKKHDELFLCIFEMGKQPVIKITTYIECIND